MAVNTREAVGWALLSNLLVHSSFISICTDCMWYSVSNILRRSIYLQDNIFRSSFEGLVPFSLSLCLYFLHTGHFPIWNTRHLRSPVNQEHGCMCIVYVPCCQAASILKSWSQSSRQFSQFSGSGADRRSDRWWTSQCIWSPRTQSAGRTMLKIKLFVDWLVVLSKEKLYFVSPRQQYCFQSLKNSPWIG